MIIFLFFITLIIQCYILTGSSFAIFSSDYKSKASLHYESTVFARKDNMSNQYDEKQVVSIPTPSRGVGRNGYNLTHLALCNYDMEVYHSTLSQLIWDLNIQLCHDYYKEHSDLNVPMRYVVSVPSNTTTNNVYLGRWLYQLRKKYQKNPKLIPIQQQLYLNHTFQFNWLGSKTGFRPSVFIKRCDELKQFVQIHHHGHVPIYYKENVKLGLWVERMRGEYKKYVWMKYYNSQNNHHHHATTTTSNSSRKGTSVLDIERIKMLQNSGFEFPLVTIPPPTTSTASTSYGDKFVDCDLMTIQEKIICNSHNVNINEDETMVKNGMNNIQTIHNDKESKPKQNNTILNEGIVIKHKRRVLSTSRKQKHEDIIIRSKYEHEWRIMFDAWKQKKTTQQNNENQKHNKSQEESTLYIWTIHQQRQYNIFLGNQISKRDKVRRMEQTNPNNNSHRLKSFMTNSRFQALSQSGFDFQMHENQHSCEFYPWDDIAKIQFDDSVLDALLSRYLGQFLAQNSTDISYYVNPDNHHDLMLYWFHRRIQWECIHYSELTDGSTNSDQILYSNNHLLQGQMKQCIPTFTLNNVVTTDPALKSECDWWENYYDYQRYIAHHDGHNIIHTSTSNEDIPWFSEKLRCWISDQKDAYDEMVLSPFTNGDESNFDSLSSLKEWHYQALRDIYFPFIEKGMNDYLSIYSPIVGRKPIVLSLESELRNDFENLLPDEMNEVMNMVGHLENRKHLSEEFSWFVRYIQFKNYYTADINKDDNHLQGISNNNEDDNSSSKLDLWARNQRKQYNLFIHKRKSTITLQRINLLNKIGFDWGIDNMNSNHDAQWEERLQALSKFKEKHGNCYVPAEYSINPRLGQWVHVQRQRFRLTKGTKSQLHSLPLLSKVQIEQLRNTGLDLTKDNMSFSCIAFQTVWDTFVQELITYKNKFGDCNVPIDLTSQYYYLGLWVNEQRILYQRFSEEGIYSNLDEQRIEELERLGFSWHRQ